MTTSETGTHRWDSLDFGPPAEGPEPDEPVVVEYVADDRIAIITLNRPHADNAITTKMGARLTEVLETIAAGPGGGAGLTAGAGARAFSADSDLRQPVNRTKEAWRPQREKSD